VRFEGVGVGSFQLLHLDNWVGHGRARKRCANLRRAVLLDIVRLSHRCTNGSLYLFFQQVRQP
jgi:hypothetical protein